MIYRISDYGLNYIRILLHKYHIEGCSHDIFDNIISHAEESMNMDDSPSIHFKANNGQYERFYLHRDCFEEIGV